MQKRTIPLTNDWTTATAFADRIYPGTRAWLLSCSHGEGGHGSWVRYGGGSYYQGYTGVGGWMQFMHSTYYSNNEAAFADARARGFIIDEKANSWFHPLGQAITAAHMRWRGWSHSHWNPSEDPNCY